MNQQQSFADILVSLLIALLGFFSSCIIAIWQTSAASHDANAALVQTADLAEDQTRFNQYLNELETWRKNPLLVQLSNWQKGETMKAVLQNTGGRDVVLYSIDFEVLLPINEQKFGALPDGTTRGTVDTADRSKVLPLDFSTKKTDGFASYAIDPPAIIEPGKTLVLQVKLNPRSMSSRLFVMWNSPNGTSRLDVGDFQQMPQ